MQFQSAARTIAVPQALTPPQNLARHLPIHLIYQPCATTAADVDCRVNALSISIHLTKINYSHTHPMAISSNGCLLPPPAFHGNVWIRRSLSWPYTAAINHYESPMDQEKGKLYCCCLLKLSSESRRSSHCHPYLSPSLIYPHHQWGRTAYTTPMHAPTSTGS